MAEFKGEVEDFLEDMVPFFKRWNGNKMSLKTDKSYYVEGELVTGVIKVKLGADVICSGVMLKVTGIEKTEWDEVHTEFIELPPVEEGEGEELNQTRAVDHVEERGHKKQFFKERIRVSDELQLLEAGKHEFRFEYQLPDDLPGVFKYKKKQKYHLRTADGDTEEVKLKTVGYIVYKLKCYLDFEFAKDLKAKQELVVHEVLDQSITPAHAETVQEVRLCCCIPRGECELIADFDKTAYAPGETAQCHSKVDNRSSSDVGAMVVKLMRTITLKDKHGHHRNIRDTVLEERYEGVPAGEQREVPMPLTLDDKMQPSTKGSFVNCQYHFDVECDISMAPDIELHMPMRLYAPPPATWGIEDSSSDEED